MNIHWMKLATEKKFELFELVKDKLNSQLTASDSAPLLDLEKSFIYKARIDAALLPNFVQIVSQCSGTNEKKYDFYF